MNRFTYAAAGFIAFSSMALTGCHRDSPRGTEPAANTRDKPNSPRESADEAAAERSKLTPEDRALVEAQEWCVVANERLGTMGPPIKLDIQGQPVFVCCKVCVKKAEADREKTLAKVEELKAKAKAEKGARR